MEHVLRFVNGVSLVLPDTGATAEELSGLLTARFGAAEAGATRAVALEDVASGLIFPLNVVASRADFVAQAEKLQVLFSCSPETILLGQLKRKGLLSEQEVRTLTPLCDDPFVSAAFEVFRAEGDEADLVDTLQRIVAIRVGPSSSASGAVAASAQAKSTSQTPASGEKQLQRKLSGHELLQQLSAALQLPEFPHEKLRQVCASLKSKGKISGDEEAVLVQLINKELPHLQAAYEIFLEEKDEQALLSSLKRVARHFGIERVVRRQKYARKVLDAFAAGNPLVCGAWDLYVDEHNEDDFRDTLQRCVQRLDLPKSFSSPAMDQRLKTQQDDSTTEKSKEEPVTAPSEAKVSLRRFVLWLHSQGRITSEQGQRLMALVNEGSPDAERAMNKYMSSGRSESDGDVLLKTVLDILEKDFPSRNEDEGTGDEVEIEDVQEEQEEMMRQLEQMYADEETGDYDDEEEEGNDDEDDGDDDDQYIDDEEDENLRQSISAFIDDLAGDMQMLTKESAQKLKVLVDARDARILAAFDLFSDEKDLNDLVDTLQRLADKVVLVGHQDTEEAEEEDVEHNLESLFDVIAGMDLSLTYLEIIRDAMEIRHPEIERAIDNFARTQDRDAFKSDLCAFCESQL